MGKIEEAKKMFCKSLQITSKFFYEIIDFVKKKGIKFIIAPYEADAQLTYLNNQGYVDVVITEDSDLIALGCTDIIYKLKTNGDCDHIC